MNAKQCQGHLLPIRDTLDLIGGKWKLLIIATLCRGAIRFRELQRELGGITARMLSKELKELEANHVIERKVFPTVPVTVEYSITPYGHTLLPVVQALFAWGEQHRRKIISGEVPAGQNASVMPDECGKEGAVSSCP